MLKRLNIILCFLLIFSFDWTSAHDNFKVFFPEFIPSNGNFEVSIITSKKFPEAEKLDIYLLPDFSLNIIKVELWTRDNKKQIPVRKDFITESSESYQKVSIDLFDTTRLENEEFFQLVIKLKSTHTNRNSLKFYGEFVREEKIVGYLTNSESKIISNITNQYVLCFEYYEKYSTAEYAASLIQNSYLNVPLIYNFENVFAFEFWMKAKNFNSTFLEIVNWETNWIEYYISINENQMLEINSKENNLFRIEPFFISQNIWYHFNLNFDERNHEISFFCNEEELARIKIINFLEFDNLVLHFQNDIPSGEFYLEQLRLINFKDSFIAISRNRNYTDYSDDSSNVISQINFSETELDNLQDNKSFSYENIRLIKSDAPLFPRAPEISFKLMNNFYEIEWTGGSYRDVDHYSLEKSVGNSNFIVVGNQAANNDEEKSYSMLSEINANTEIVYFRIKQVNRDGSEVYSDVIKVGQGIIEDLIVEQNFPNPFNPTTLIEFELLQDADVEVKVFDLAGKEVAILHSGILSSGEYKFKFDASGFPSGIYLYQISTPLSSQTKKMILAK